MQRLRNYARSFLELFLDLLENITAGLSARLPECRQSPVDLMTVAELNPL
jgi:hypothetical protein